MKQRQQLPVCVAIQRMEYLVRKWSPLDMPANDEWRVISQIIVPSEYRMKVLHLAHEAPMAGHLGISKAYQKLHSIFTGLA